MSVLINTNSAALIAANDLNNNQANLNEDLQKLSSGLSINSAADNPAGLVITQQMQAQISGLSQAQTNSANAVSMTQTAEGALDEVNTLLDKARQLTLDAANSGVNSASQDSADQAELDNVIASITRISQVTQFGTKNLLDGTLNGISAATSSLSYINAGNLANNPTIAPGVMTVNVTPGTKATVTMNATGSNSYIFSGTVSGLMMGTSNVNKGVTISLKISGTLVGSYTTTGEMKAGQIATKLSHLSGVVAAAYTVTANTQGQLVITPTNNIFGGSGFSAAVTFSRPGNSTGLGTNYKDTVTVVPKPGTGSGSATTYFTNLTSLSGVSLSSVLVSGSHFQFLVTASGAAQQTVTGTSTAGETLGTLLTSMQGRLQALSGFSGATISLGTGASAGGFKLVVTQDVNDTKTFGTTFFADFNSSHGSKSTLVAATIGNTLGTGPGELSSGTSSTGANATLVSYTGGAITGSLVLGSGSNIDVTLCGHTFVLTGNRSLTNIALALQTAIHAFGITGINVAFVTSGTVLSSLSGASLANTSGTHASGFVFYNIGAQVGKSISVSLKIDQANGYDDAASITKVITGAAGAAAPDMYSSGNTSALDNVGHPASSITGSMKTSTGGTLSVLAKGADSTASLVTSTGLSLGLVIGFQTSTGANLTLSTGAQALGYNGVSININSGLALGGIASFNLGQGAVFQVGANGGQIVGLTIQSVASIALGRNASTTLTSLDDLSSSKASALMTGQTTAALDVIDAAINQVTNLRGQLGAFQADTLQSGLASLQVADENLTSAEGQIKDVDFAAESADFSKNQILVQSSTAMLAQANQLPQNVLKLIGGG